MTAIDTLVAAIFLWVASNSSLSVPPIDQTNLVFIAKNETVNALYYRDLLGQESMGDVITFYDPTSNTLYVSSAYDIGNPFHRTLLFQEIVFIAEEAALDSDPQLNGEAINAARDQLFERWFDEGLPIILSSR